jgi:hypothetical protein
MVPPGSSAWSDRRCGGSGRLGMAGMRAAAVAANGQSPITAQRNPIMMKKPVNRAISPIAP